MRLLGTYTKEGDFWAIYVPKINLATQGKSKQDAFFMIQDALQELMGEKLQTRVEDYGSGKFCLIAKRQVNDE